MLKSSLIISVYVSPLRIRQYNGEMKNLHFLKFQLYEIDVEKRLNHTSFFLRHVCNGMNHKKQIDWTHMQWNIYTRRQFP